MPAHQLDDHLEAAGVKGYLIDVDGEDSYENRTEYPTDLRLIRGPGPLVAVTTRRLSGYRLAARCRLTA